MEIGSRKERKKERKRKCALTSTGLLMEGLGGAFLNLDQRFSLLVPQLAADCADVDVFVSVVVPSDLTVISSPFMFISNLSFRSKPLTNSRAALATAPARLDTFTFTADSTVPSFRSRYRNCTSNDFIFLTSLF